MKKDPILGRFVGADAIFLDTTYCNPKFVFPLQAEAIDYVVNTIERIRAENEGGSVLILIATYVIGKERILLEISRRCRCLLHVDSRKMGVLSILGFGDSGVFTEDASASDVHVIGWNLLGDTWPYFRPNFVKMKEIMTERGYSKVVGFVATGWMYETKREGSATRVKDQMEIHLVPCSEHSSYEELREYVRFLRPKRVIPTVGADVDKVDGKGALALQKHFSGLLDENANKHEFLMAFSKKVGNADAMAVDNLMISTNRIENGEEGRGNSSQEFPLEDLNDEDIEKVTKELHDCLPSWVTEDQILGLLRGSKGDVIEAVTEFFEHETEFYEKANACLVPTPNTPIDLQSYISSFSDVKSSQGCGTKLLDIGKKPVSEILAAPKACVGKKRGSTVRNKTKKKGKTSTLQSSQDYGSKLLGTGKKLGNASPGTPKTRATKKRGSSIGNKKGKASLTLESGGSKQSTITKFFGKVVPVSTSHGNQCNVLNEDMEMSAEDSETVDTIEMYRQELDQFLQIIDNGIARNTAASLLKKTQGNIGVAVDMYYSICSRVFGEEESFMHCNDKTEMSVEPSDSCTEMASDTSQKKTSLPSLFVHGTSADDRSLLNVSLPIEKYSPVEHACWKAGEPAPYLHLARTFDLVEREKGKLKTTAVLCNMFRSLLALSPDDVLPAVYLCTNKIAADHENMELNVGGNLVISALEEAWQTSKSRIKEMYNSIGDLGDVAQECQQAQTLLVPHRPLSIRNLFHALKKISAETGNGSAVRRKNLIVNLMRSCREMEMKFIVRTLVRNLRIGAMMRTILPALGQAVVLNDNSPKHVVESSECLKSQLQGISAAIIEAYNVIPNLVRDFVSH